ncbi:tetratricopeptide repeat protein [Pontiella agarivorans]|uniref:Tetratricopeptide repeat protein n=1 Tax=Pontiella agarivorans TaxID=3038953 RepID=A0ABU5MVA2_9BACT|nr:tetratricopeptide repeat protein [Pontiella agarivorans]MDZ8118149.1 tetratricopeptide repeat protein [Pontiella agarivorans]
MKPLLFLLVLSSALNALPQVPIPVSSLWKSETFRKQFTASYGIDAAVEPRISPEEKQILDAVAGKMQEEDRNGAILKLKENIRLSDSPALQFTLANLLTEENRTAEAVPHFEKAVSLYPSFRDAYRNLALALVQEGRTREAMEPLVRAIELRAADGLTYGLLAYVHSDAGQYASALQAYRQAQLLMPDEWQWKLGEANTLLALEAYSAAAKHFGELIARQPENEQLWLAQADAFLADGKIEQAIANREIVRGMDKLNPDERLVLGHLYLSIDLPNPALDCYLESIADVEPAAAMEALNRLIAARQWKQAETLIPAMPVTGPEVKRAKAFIQIQSGEIPAGIRTLEHVVSKNPLDFEALLMLGKAYRQTGQWEKSTLILEQAARGKTTEIEALLMLGQVFAEQGRFDDAIQTLEKAYRLQPNPSVSEYIAAIRSLQRHS